MRLVVVVLVWALLAAGLKAWAVEDRETFRLILSGDSIAEAIHRARSGPQLQEPQALASVGPRRHEELRKEHESLEGELNRRGLHGASHTRVVLNSILVHAPLNRLAELRALPGVRSVHPVHHHTRMLTTSVPYVRAPAFWGAKPPAGGFTGKGIRIGIIDSGIDYLHADFGGSGRTDDYQANDPTLIEPGTFPTPKVVGGFDLAGDDYDSSTPGFDTPNPDADPLDPSGDGHGSHVAGIAAGFGVLADGSTFAGPYDASVYTHNFRIGPGVAPEALLYAIKIFGTTGSTALAVEGMDWAADPDGDGNTEDHLDVVNLSLGSPFGSQDPMDPEQIAIRQLSSLGCVVVVAAGNEGDTHYIVGSPSVAPEAISVANIFDDGVPLSSVRITAPPAVAGSYISLEGAFTPSLQAVGPVEAPVVASEPADGCDTLSNGSALSGAIALIDRGSCFFSDKVRAAQKAGAVGVIIVNNIPGLPVPMAGTGDTSDLTIPAVMIGEADGTLLRRQLANGLTARLAATAGILHPELAGRVEESSSRGPVLESSRLKPDIAAPGSGIVSVKAGAGTDGIAQWGTSMSTPHVAGAAALVRQAHPEWSASDIKAALMNSAAPCYGPGGFPYPETRVGSGMLDLEAASRLTFLARDADAPAEVSIAFGAIELAAPTNLTRTIRVDNKGAALSLQVVATNTLAQPGVQLTFSTNHLEIPAGGNATVAVQMSIDPARLVPHRDPLAPDDLQGYPMFAMTEASGQIHFIASTATAHVPFLACIRPAAATRVAATTFGLPTDPRTTVRLPSTGTGSHFQPLVSVFEFGATSPSQGLPFPDSSEDLLAVGAASDILSAGSVSQAHLFFGLAVAGKWTAPQRALGNLDIEIDLNSDGIPDFTIANSTQGNVLTGFLEDPTSATDAQLSVVYQGASGDFPDALLPEAPLNVLDPLLYDTALFQNAVLVHGVAARDIGLTATRTKFRYRAKTLSPAAEDHTAWISYDIARPQINACTYGIEGSPFFLATNGIVMDVMRSNAPAGATSIRALVLHQNNLPGNQVQMVTMRFDTADFDNNGLPDVWELAFLGKLGNLPQDDPDHDGATNAQEAVARTNPADPASVFRILAVDPPQPGQSAVVRWLGSSGVTYNVERSDALSGVFVPVRTGIPGVAGTNAVADPNPPPGTALYRVRIP
jgi:subtilisin family serine protease